MPIRVRLPRYLIWGQGVGMCQHVAPIDGDSIPLDLSCIDLLPFKSHTPYAPTALIEIERARIPQGSQWSNLRFILGRAEKLLSGWMNTRPGPGTVGVAKMTSTGFNPNGHRWMKARNWELKDR